MDDKWRHNLKDSLEGFQADEPEGLWEGIESSLTSGRKRRLYPVYIVAAAVACVAVALPLLLLNRNVGSPDNIAEVPAQSSDGVRDNTAEISAQSSDGGSIAEKDEASAATIITPESISRTSLTAAVLTVSPSEQPEKSKEKTPDYETSGQSAIPSGAEKAVEALQNEKYGADVSGATVKVTEVPGEKVKAAEVPHDMVAVIPDENESRIANPENYDDFSDVERHRQKSGHSLALSLSSSNGIGQSSNSAGYAALFGSNAAMLAQGMPSGFRSQQLSEVLIDNIGTEINTKVTHYQPVRFGLSLWAALTGKIGVETGIAYTLAISSLSSGSSGSHYDTRQTLHYIGIPLNLTIDLWRSGKYSLYMSGGGMMEKCVAGASVTNYHYSDDTQDRGRNSIGIEQLQWSVNAAAGLSYRLLPPVSLYFEPGVSYHFDNGSAVETIYKQRPLNFSFRLGLRYSLRQ